MRQNAAMWNMAGGCFGIMMLVFGVSVVVMRTLTEVGIVLCILGSLTLIVSFAAATRKSLLASLRVKPASAHYEIGDHISFTGGGKFRGDTYVKGATAAEDGELLIGDEGVVMYVISDDSLRCSFPEVQVSLSPEDVVFVDVWSKDNLPHGWVQRKHADCPAFLRRVVFVVLLISTKFASPVLPREVWVNVLHYLTARHLRKGSNTELCIPWSRILSPTAVPLLLPDRMCSDLAAMPKIW